MSIRNETTEAEEPPATKAAAMVDRVSQSLLLFFCASPIAILALALAHRGLLYLFR